MATIEPEKKEQAGTKAPAKSERRPLHDLRSEIERMFDDAFSEFSLMPFRRWRPSVRTGFEMTMPAMDVIENEKEYRITAELPGIEEKDLDVSVSDDLLTIRGEKRQEREEKTETRRLSERSYGSFERSLRLPAGADAEKIEANFRKGVLTITLPKSEEAQKRQRRIDVKAE